MIHIRQVGALAMMLGIVLTASACGSGTAGAGDMSSVTSSSSAATKSVSPVTLTASEYLVGNKIVRNALDGEVALRPGVYEVTNGGVTGGIEVRRGPTGGETSVFLQKMSSTASTLHAVTKVRVSLRKGDVLGVLDGSKLTFTPVKDRSVAMASVAAGDGADIEPGLYDFGTDLPAQVLTLRIASKLVGDDGTFPAGEAGYRVFGTDSNGDVSGDMVTYGFSRADQSLTLGSTPQARQYLSLYGANSFHVTKG